MKILLLLLLLTVIHIQHVLGAYTDTVTDLYTTAPQAWVDTIASADGQTIISVTAYDMVTNGLIVKSTDGGDTWSTISLSGGTGTYLDLWASRDASKILIADYGNDLYYSSDSGSSFVTLNLNSKNLEAVTASDDGSTIFVAIGNDGIYKATSVTGGTTSWTQAAAVASSTWNGACSSDNGVYSAFVEFNGGQSGLYFSSNSGVSYTTKTIPYTSGNYLQDVACDSTGQYFAVAVYNAGLIYVSSDYGATFTLQSSYTDRINAISISSDGSFMAAMSMDGYVSISDDYGVNWEQMASYPNNAQVSTACNYLGGKLDSSNTLFTASDSGYIIKYVFSLLQPTYEPTYAPTDETNSNNVGNDTSDDAGSNLLGLIALIALIPCCGFIYYLGFYRCKKDEKKEESKVPEEKTAEMVEIVPSSNSV